ncbi:FCP [Symbiodinium pilosum]|uniref:FCP protein n=1 Tax=Symbiodinium pilosum TaxID=2952 RepID=A0A812Y0H9_SYMPI|nr:FCP [Symbiodinium pilosum]
MGNATYCNSSLQILPDVSEQIQEEQGRQNELFTKDAPAPTNSSDAFDVSRQIGVQQSFGIFDPLRFTTGEVWKPLRRIVPRIGFSQDRGRVGLGFGVNTEFEPSSLEISEDERWFRRLREAELKHGRIAMLAASGFFAAHVVRVPGFEDAAEGISAGLANESWQRISLLIFIFCGQFERNQFRQEAGREIGDFGDPLKLGQYTPEVRLGELVNGRLAMLSCAIIAGLEFSNGVPATQVWFPL